VKVSVEAEDESIFLQRSAVDLQSLPAAGFPLVADAFVDPAGASVKTSPARDPDRLAPVRGCGL